MPKPDVCVSVQLKNTHHSWPLTCLYEYTVLSQFLRPLWTWPHPVVERWSGGGGWVATYQPVHVCLLDRLCVFLYSAAMQSSARGNQLQSVTLSCCVGEESLHLSVLMNKDSAVWFRNKKQVLELWTVPSCHLSIKGGNVSHTQFTYHFSWGMRWAIGFFFIIIINELISQAVALVTVCSSSIYNLLFIQHAFMI